MAKVNEDLPAPVRPTMPTYKHNLCMDIRFVSKKIKNTHNELGKFQSREWHLRYAETVKRKILPSVATDLTESTI
jgi:hypothetical protein